jgi:gliding motility-associated-like protein
MRKYLATIFFIILSYLAAAQPQINNWFFSSHNGLNFSSGTPTYISGQIGVNEGGSAISDRNGQLLFYSDGIRVWNKQHVIMPNGSGLTGGYGSSTQSCVIVPKTLDGRYYYIFTTDEEGGTWGLRYSIVDMTLSSGNGDVTAKNIPLLTPVSEKVTAVMHCNRKDYWVICHKYGSDAYYSYLASDTGVNTNPVISHVGAFIPITYATMAGSLKASPDGRKLVAASGETAVELFDFNNATGIVSNGASIFNNSIPGIPYGVEFSANSTKLYVSVTHYWDSIDFRRYSGVFQFDLTQPTIAGIVASKTQLVRYDSGNEMGQLQRGPDGKIYMSQYQKAYLSVINSPEIAGAGCGFVTNGFSLPNMGIFNLPNFINDYYAVPDSFRIISNSFCVNVPIEFSYNISGGVTSVLWDFDNPSSGVQNSSTSLTPSHNFSSSGNYRIKLIKYGPCGTDTLKKTITISDIIVNLGSDTSFCELSSVQLDPHTSGPNTYLWNNSSTNSVYNATTAGEYWVEVTNNVGCKRRDTILVTSKPLPQVNLGKDTSLCVGQSLLLDAQNNGAQFLWQNSSSQETLSVDQSGSYWVEVTVNGCKTRDEITISPAFQPSFSLGPDQLLCPDQPILLSPGLSSVNYRWQDGSLTPTYLVTKKGAYYVDITNTCGATRDSINIIDGTCKLYVPSAFTPNDDGLNDLFKVSGTSSVTEFEMRIFNRWGQLLFFSKNPNSGWNGIYNGSMSLPGVYIYSIKYKEMGATGTQYKKGSVTLIK